MTGFRHVTTLSTGATGLASWRTSRGRSAHGDRRSTRPRTSHVAPQAANEATPRAATAQREGGRALARPTGSPFRATVLPGTVLPGSVLPGSAGNRLSSGARCGGVAEGVAHALGVHHPVRWSGVPRRRCIAAAADRGSRGTGGPLRAGDGCPERSGRRRNPQPLWGSRARETAPTHEITRGFRKCAVARSTPERPARARRGAHSNLSAFPGSGHTTTPLRPDPSPRSAGAQSTEAAPCSS